MRLFTQRSLHLFGAAFFALVCSAWSASAQTYRVTATVIAPDNEPEEFCTYRIFTPNDTVRPIAGDIADADGFVNATLPGPGDYTMTISADARMPLSVKFAVSPQQPVADLGKLTTVFNGETLSELTVTAQRPLVTKQIDRIGYDVQADPEASTSNLREIMRKVPMVSVDDEGNIKVNGSSNFKIYKNGRPNNAFTKNAKDIFLAIPASTIKKVEVITDPGAREDAESSGVILNIVTTSTSSMSGISANVGLEYSTQMDAPTANAFIMTQVKKLTMSGSGGFFKFGRHAAEGQQTEHVDYQTTGASSHTVTDYNAKGRGGWFNVEGSLELDTMNLFTTALNGFVGRNGINTYNTFEMFGADNSPLYGYKSTGFYPTDGYTDIDFNFDYQHSTRRPGETLTLSYRLSHTNQTQIQNTEYSDMVNAPFGYTGIISDFDLQFFEHTFQFDWSRPFAKHYILDTGAKYILRSSHSKNNQDLVGLPDGVTANEFEHRYHIFGIYADARATYGALTARAGVRYEYSRLGADFILGDGNNFHSNLNDVVPNASVAWNASQSSMWKLSYNRRIQRPGISYLNPAVTETPTSIKYGNPDLSSTGLNNLLLNYSLFKSKFNLDLTATFSTSNNGVGDLQWTDNNNILHSTYDNFTHNSTVTLSGFFQWQITDKTSWMFNGAINHGRYSVSQNGEKVKLGKVYGNFYTRVSQKLPWDINMSVGAFYWSGVVTSAYNYFSNPIKSINYDVTLKRSFLKDKTLDISLSARNLGLSHRTQHSYTLNNGYLSTNNNTMYHQAAVSIGVNWRFGSLKARVKKTANTITNDDLQGRKNSDSSTTGGM